MADNTQIEWTDATWNPITGCSVTSPGCTNCYAMQLAGTRLKHAPSRKGLTQPSKAGPVWTGEVRFNEHELLKPLRWKRPRMIFVCAHGDLFHESVPDEWIDRVFAVMALSPQHTFQVLTKRSARMREYFGHEDRHRAVMVMMLLTAAKDLWLDTMALNVAALRIANPWPLPNVWLGVSVEDQQRADERIPDLLATPAAVRWISAEPLLGPISIIDAMWARDHIVVLDETLDWVVAGGESGSKARPMHPDWARCLRDQCAAAAVPFFFKQWGEYHPADQLKNADQIAAMGEMGTALRSGAAHSFEDQWTWKIGKKRAGRLLDGVEHNGMPVQ